MFQELTSPSWWGTVVVAGILINLAAAFLLRGLDRRLARVSARWRASSAARQAARDAVVDRIRSDQRYELLATTHELRNRMRSIFLLLLGLFFVTVYTALPVATTPWSAVVFVLAVGGVSFFASFRCLLAAVHFKDVLAESDVKGWIELDQIR
jgi:hypothetical protein